MASLPAVTERGWTEASETEILVMGTRVAIDAAVGRGILISLLVLAGSGCFFMRDPLDPLGALDHRAVHEFGRAEQEARGRFAYERARRRVEWVTPGMSVAEVEVAMEALVVAERRGNEDDEMLLPRKKLLEGLLCKISRSARRQRWIFGYDEGGVELIGFAVEFERDDPENEGWVVRQVDRGPNDDCRDASAG
jgi:hypothetical protein